MKITKYIIFTLWAIFLCVCIITYISNPALFSVGNITLFLKKFNNYILIAYILIFLLRGFTLLPNTPFVIAGTLIFPGHPLMILIISIICILSSSTLIYYFSEFLGFDTFFEKKYPEKIDYLRTNLNKPKGLIFIFLLSFIPIFPTDLASYIAGTIRMNIAKLLGGIFLGELTLCAFYIFVGSSAVTLLK